jgi:hypothetical protein
MIFDESLTGPPPEKVNMKVEFPVNTPEDCFPQFRRERMGLGEGKAFTCDDLVEFLYMKADRGT